MEMRDRLIDTRPKQSWEEFVERMPPGKAPTLKDIIDRWSEYEQQTITRDGVTRVVRGASRDNGEERAYRAWLLGVMEREEERYFGMLTLRGDVLVQVAIVPVVRGLLAYTRGLEAEVSTLSARVQTLEKVVAP